MKSRKVVKIGLDFDGVVTYNPMRLARLSVSFFKRRVLKIQKLGFFVPKNDWQRLIYRMGIIWPSMYPARGINTLKEMAKSPKYKFYLLTGRYGFTKPDTYKWLHKNQLENVFENVFLNERNEQPHLFKLRIIKAKKFDYYIEDNLDIVRDLTNRKSKARVVWIYNIVDGWKNFPEKYPYLEKALEKIKLNENSN